MDVIANTSEWNITDTKQGKSNLLTTRIEYKIGVAIMTHILPVVIALGMDYTIQCPRLRSRSCPRATLLYKHVLSHKELKQFYCKVDVVY